MSSDAESFISIGLCSYVFSILLPPDDCVVYTLYLLVILVIALFVWRDTMTKVAY